MQSMQWIALSSACFFFASRRRHTRCSRVWSSDVCSSDLPDNLRARLFDPFVTGRAGGTGLGLAIVQRAVEAHRGLVLVDSVQKQGTTFTVYFPAARRKEEAA